MKKGRAPSEKGRIKQLKRMALLSLLLCIFFSATMAVSAHASDITINVGSGDEAGGMGPIEIIFIFAFLSLLPSIFLMMTSFTRIIIVLGFTRNAIGTGQSPPNMVLVGLAIFLSLFIMGPVISQMNEVALKPFQAGELTTTQALNAASLPVKQFMVDNMEPDSLRTFMGIANREMPMVEDPANPVEIYALPLTIITPAFIVSEISKAFMMGFFIFLPFLVIDMVVSSILMSMGMVMLPPAMIALPFKILLFVMVDGWNLLMGTLMRSFSM